MLWVGLAVMLGLGRLAGPAVFAENGQFPSPLLHKVNIVATPEAPKQVPSPVATEEESARGGTEKAGRPAGPAPAGTANPFYAKSWGVVIGINQYSKWPGLEYAVNDAKAVGDRLKALEFDEVIEVLDRDATRERLLELLGNELPKKVSKQDRVVIFFAGHGQTEELASGRQKGYIIPVDASTQVFSQAISMEEVRELSERIPAKHILYVIDACYSGLGLSRAGSITPTVAGYLRKVTSIRAVQMVTAGSKGEQVIEKNGHGLFTAYFLRALDGEADFDNDGVVTASELGAFLRPQVSQNTDNRQTPQYGRLDGEGEVVFLKPGVRPRGLEEVPPEQVAAAPPADETARGASTAPPVAPPVPPSTPPVPALPPPGPPQTAKLMPSLPQLLPPTLTGKDGAAMALIPAGEFLMGTSDKDLAWLTRACKDCPAGDFADEMPQRRVTLGPFYLDVHEVTRARYQAFVKATGTPMPAGPGGNLPVSGVTWEQAQAYCAWAGKRLPTEAEWEKAARGSDGRLFPWGGIWDKSVNNSASRLGGFDIYSTKQRAAWWKQEGEMLFQKGGVAAVLRPGGSFPNGAGPYGVHDLAGSVWEWVADWYDPQAYRSGQTDNPKGPAAGQYKVIRGGAWDSRAIEVRATQRQGVAPTSRAETIGFRCAQDPGGAG
jgi:formylglycine-generating enzyme required for sulfatase activity